MPEELPLEPDLIKVLAADTRREILSLLQDRRMTVTELARELDLGKATVHEHLDKLTGAELVERHEDDRLWVYYGLTPRGKRLLNPQRTRFYLALASAAVAALVAGLAVYAFMATGGIGAPADTAQQVDVLAQPTQDEIYAGQAVEVPARLEAGDDVHAYLVDEASAQRIREGDYSAQGLPLRAYTPTAQTGDVQARDETTVLRSDASLEPGTYHLYVRDDERDNADAMPTVRVVGLEAQPDRTTWYQALDEGPLTVNVTREGQPAKGQLRLAGPQGATPNLVLDEGRAELPERLLDQAEPGRYAIAVQPEDATRWVHTDTHVEIRPASAALVPLHVDEQRFDPLHLHLTGPSRLKNASPTVHGAEARIQSVEDGWRLDLANAEPGRVRVDLVRTSHEVEVHPSLAVEATVQDGPQLQWTVRDPGGEPLAEAAVYLDGRARGFTDANGTLTTDLPDEGPHRLTVHRPDGATITRAVTVDGWRVTQADPAVRVDPVDVASTPVSATITVEVTNDGRLPQPLTLVAELAGQPAAASSLTVPANATSTTAVTVPADLGRQQVTVSAQPLPAGPFGFTNETSAQGETESSQDGDTSGGNATADQGSFERDDGGDDPTTATVGGGGGSATASGDADGDGIPGTKDACPEEAGVETNDGCPVEQAADGEALASPGPLEPVRPRAAQEDAVADGQAEQTPGIGLAAALALLALAASLGRRRKP